MVCRYKNHEHSHTGPSCVHASWYTGTHVCCMCEWQQVPAAAAAREEQYLCEMVMRPVTDADDTRGVHTVTVTVTVTVTDTGSQLGAP